IGGKFGGRVIQVPKGLPARPTTDRTKEALFNILAHQVDWESAHVLDLFAGTGNISLECWSRGAQKVVSVEKDHRSVQAIKKNLQLLKVGQAQVIKMDVRKYLAQAKGSFDFIFMDPPYDMPGQTLLIKQIFDGELVAPEGILVVEHRKSVSFEDVSYFEQVRKYGDSSLSFFYLPEAADK
ncbi:MAG: 16S rRNA (guanine(966)-N(2))-methyltransferase RsmD, partial [Bacteroidota bacterium]